VEEEEYIEENTENNNSDIESVSVDSEESTEQEDSEISTDSNDAELLSGDSQNDGSEPS
jgi:hypothetical protein